MVPPPSKSRNQKEIKQLAPIPHQLPDLEDQEESLSTSSVHNADWPVKNIDRNETDQSMFLLTFNQLKSNWRNSGSLDEEGKSNNITQNYRSVAQGDL